MNLMQVPQFHHVDSAVVWLKPLTSLWQRPLGLHRRSGRPVFTLHTDLKHLGQNTEQEQPQNVQISPLSLRNWTCLRLYKKCVSDAWKVWRAWRCYHRCRHVLLILTDIPLTRRTSHSAAPTQTEKATAESGLGCMTTTLGSWSEPWDVSALFSERLSNQRNTVILRLIVAFCTVVKNILRKIT